eukprot:jgi/Chrzof1/7990/UNPLg00041.t1
MDQWVERIQQFAPAATIGYIKQDKVEVEDCDIVIASLQSLAMRDYDGAIFSGFGLVIMDEVHHTSARVFSRALPKVTTNISLGLSATMTRKDGLTKVFKWWLGDVMCQVKREADTDVKVTVLDYYSADPAYCTEHHTYMKGEQRINTAKMINCICAYGPRTRLIADTARKYLCDPRRKFLIVSERRAHLAELQRLLAD